MSHTEFRKNRRISWDFIGYFLFIIMISFVIIKNYSILITSSKYLRSIFPDNSGLKGVGIVFFSAASQSQAKFEKKQCFFISCASSLEDPNRLFG